MRALVFFVLLTTSGCASTLAYGASALFDATVLECEALEAAQRDYEAVRTTCDGMYDGLGSYVDHLKDLEKYEKGL